MNNKKITIEIITGLSIPNSERFSLFNFRVKSIENITDKQRINFNKTHDNQTGNISELHFLIRELEDKLICVVNDLNRGVKK